MLFTGLDIEEVQRVQRLLNERPDLLRKIFTEYEWRYAKGKKTAQTLTGIWCAKEAVVKAFSSITRLDIRDIIIRHDLKGAPYCAKIQDFEFESKYKIVLSISHTKTYAVASCISYSGYMDIWNSKSLDP